MTDGEVDRSDGDGIPTRAALDRTAGLLLEGYPFLAKCRRRWGTGPGPAEHAVELRLLAERVVCVGGPEAVRLFYDPQWFRRRDAIPRPLARTLFGKGAVHVHDVRYSVEAQRQHYQELFDQAPAVYLVTDRVGVIREANRRAASLLGVAQHFLAGRPLAMIVTPQDRWGFGIGSVTWAALTRGAGSCGCSHASASRSW